jgi:hypothetical protein
MLLLTSHRPWACATRAWGQLVVLDDNTKLLEQIRELTRRDDGQTHPDGVQQVTGQQERTPARAQGPGASLYQEGSELRHSRLDGELLVPDDRNCFETGVTTGAREQSLCVLCCRH